jgi:hypothetical protein
LSMPPEEDLGKIAFDLLQAVFTAEPPEKL